MSDNLDDFDSFGNMTDKHYELIKGIWVHNCYELWTESEGKRHQRCIGVYKEAPAHVYLITPEDLNESHEQATTKIKTDKDFDYIDSDEERKKKRVKKIKGKKKECHPNTIKKEQNITEKQKDDEGDIRDIKIHTEKDCDVFDNDKKEHMEIDVQNIGDVEGNGNHNNLVLNEQSICENHKDIDDKCDVQIKKENDIDNISNVEHQYKFVKMEYKEKTILNNLPIKEQVISNNKNNNERSADVSNEIDKDDNEQVKVINETDMSQQNKIQSHAELNEHVKAEMKDNEKNILGKIVEYFKEFCDDETFKEFRFLGPFNDEELENINLFFNICMKCDQVECNEKLELLKLFDDYNSLNVLVDNNGKRFIKKFEENAELPTEDDDDVICIDQ